jgi:hypothetical protein
LGERLPTLTEVWYSTIFIFGLAVVLVCYLAHKNESKIRLVQGFAGVCGGVLSLFSLFLPWITLQYPYGIGLSGFEIGDTFTYLIGSQFLKAISFFLFLFSFLIILGGYLYIMGYAVGEKLIETSSGIALFISVIVVLALSFTPVEQLPVTIEVNSYIYIFGAIVGLISTRLEKGET